METNHKEGSKRQVSGLNRFFSYFLLLPIYFYRYFISPMLGPRCRFNPTCSSYAEQAIKRYGIFKGTWLAVCRIAKCHPWHPGGEDPVPPLESDKSKSDNHP